MLNCLKILEEAGNKGVLQSRSLESMKKSRGANKPKEGPKTTGITVPNTVFGQPVDEDVGDQMHIGVASYLKKKKEEYDAKYQFKCPLVACGQRTVPGLKAHWRIKHDGIEFPGVAAASAVVCESPPSVAATATAASKRTKTQHSENGYETCSVCNNHKYLKKNRSVHLASEMHLGNAASEAKTKHK
jgi:hypothetical protein